MLPVLTYAEEYVKNLYERIGVKEPKDLDYRIISERLNIKVFHWNHKSQALFFKEKGYIMLQEDLSPQYEWQHYLHELAHVLLHTGNQKLLPESFVKYQEEKANQFMLHAAVPTLMLHKLKLTDCTRSNIHLVQQIFNVDEELAKKRLTQYISRKYSMLNWNIHTEHLEIQYTK